MLTSFVKMNVTVPSEESDLARDYTVTVTNAPQITAMISHEGRLSWDTDYYPTQSGTFKASSDITGTGFDLSAGLYYSHKDWYAGVSALHFNSPRVELGETNELDISSTYYLTGGYNIRLRNPFFTIHPTMLARTDGSAWRVDVGGRVRYQYEKRMLYAGASYSPTNSVTLLIGGNFHGISLGYSYEFYTNGISIGNGSHELCVGYQLDLDFGKKGRNRHQSVRLL